MAGKAEVRSTGHEGRRGAIVADRTVFDEWRMDRAACEQMRLVRAVRIVAFRTVDSREIDPQMEPAEDSVRSVVAAQTQLIDLGYELIRVVAPVWPVTGLASERQGGVILSGGKRLFYFSMTTDTQVGTRSPEQKGVSRQMRVVAGRAFAQRNGGVNVSGGVLLLEITVTGVAQFSTLHLNSHPGAPGSAVAGITGTLFEWGMQVVSREHVHDIRAVRGVAGKAVAPAHWNRVEGVSFRCFVTGCAKIFCWSNEKVLLGRAVGIVAGRAPIGQRGMRGGNLSFDQWLHVVVAHQTEPRLAICELHREPLLASLELVTREAVLFCRGVNDPPLHDLLMATRALRLSRIHKGRMLRRLGRNGDCENYDPQGEDRPCTDLETGAHPQTADPPGGRSVRLIQGSCTLRGRYIPLTHKAAGVWSVRPVATSPLMKPDLLEQESHPLP